MSEDTKDMSTYLQFYPDLAIPVYVKLTMEAFTPELLSLLEKCGFAKLEEKDILGANEILKNDRSARLLTVTEASINVGRKISNFRENDQFGAESVTPRKGYSIYRFRGIGIVLYSFASREWELGCFSDFGEKEVKASAVVINRYLSWALSSLGIVGFWGVPVDDGIVVMNQMESNGEAVFVDIFNNLILSVDGASKIKSKFRIIRLDTTLKNRNVFLGPSELLSFLVVNCTYFDYQGLTIPVRQVIRKISASIPGLLHPKESFRPRTDLGLG